MPVFCAKKCQYLVLFKSFSIYEHSLQIFETIFRRNVKRYKLLRFYRENDYIAGRSAYVIKTLQKKFQLNSWNKFVFQIVYINQDAYLSFEGTLTKKLNFLKKIYSIYKEKLILPFVTKRGLSCIKEFPEVATSTRN